MTEANTDPADDGPSEESDPLPADVVEEAERLTRLARDAVDESEAAAYRDRRASLLADHDYRARVRDDDSRDVLVLHPDEWLDDGLVQVDQIEDLDRGIERPLSGPGEADDWATVDEHNQAVVERVQSEHGEVHGENAAAFAQFMSNHYARAVESVTDAEKEEFLTEYFPRNAWPSDEQRDVVDESLRLAIAAGETLSGTAE
jgi:hypothetical protein